MSFSQSSQVSDYLPIVSLSQESNSSMAYTKRRSASRYGMRKRMRYSYRRKRFSLVETKMKIFNLTGNVANASAGVVELTRIGEGTGNDERNGNKLNILRIDVRGKPVNDNLDIYLIQAHTTTDPAYTDFSPHVGGHIFENRTNTRFTEWRYSNGRRFVENSGMRHSFRLGYVAKYINDQTTGCVDNKLYLVVKNNTGADVLVTDFAVKVWFRDH